MEMTFFRDKLLIPEPHEIFFGTVRFQWTFVEDVENGTCVQVNEYPPLRVHRKPENWGWVLENHWVQYDSTNIPPKPKRI